MKIKEGDKLPEEKVFVIDMDKEYEHKEISTSEILNKDKIILFGLPGAFTPGCSKKHLPSFLESTEKLKEKNIRKVFCISVNDPFVMDAWGKNHNVQDKIVMVGDSKSEFTSKIGAVVDLSARGLGSRSSRYTMLVENGVINKISEEKMARDCTVSSAENFLKEI